MWLDCPALWLLSVLSGKSCTSSAVSTGKVCARHWYDKSKHIFPASRWEVYDPEKDYSNYTVKWATWLAGMAQIDAVQLCSWWMYTVRHQHLALVNIACCRQLLHPGLSAQARGTLRHEYQSTACWLELGNAYMYWLHHACRSSVLWSRHVVVSVEPSNVFTLFHIIPY